LPNFSTPHLKTVGEVRETADETLLSFQDLGKASGEHLRELQPPKTSRLPQISGKSRMIDVRSSLSTAAARAEVVKPLVPLGRLSKSVLKIGVWIRLQQFCRFTGATLVNQK
jgi:hypothetical protein